MNKEQTLDKQDAASVKNFTRTPNMLIFGYREISPQEKWLYVCLKHMCGKKGTRHLSLRYISEQTGISTGALSSSKNKKGEVNLGMIRHLHDAGLIHAEIKKPGKGNPQYHITITDVWGLNQAFFEKRSDFGQDEEEYTEPVRNSDEPVQISDRSVRISDEPVRNPANTKIRDKTSTKITEQEERITSTPSLDVDAHASEHSCGPDCPLCEQAHSREALKADIVQVMPEVQAEVALRQAQLPSEKGADDDGQLTETLSTPSLQRGGAARNRPTHDESRAPGKKPSKQRNGTQGDIPVPVPKCDTREIQRRVNAHRGYALEEEVEIIRERKAIKSWCNRHTLDEYDRVMKRLKNDPYWGKEENYRRIGGLTLLKETPKALAELAREHEQPQEEKTVSGLPRLRPLGMVRT